MFLVFVTLAAWLFYLSLSAWPSFFGDALGVGTARSRSGGSFIWIMIVTLETGHRQLIPHVCSPHRCCFELRGCRHKRGRLDVLSGPSCAGVGGHCVSSGKAVMGSTM